MVSLPWTRGSDERRVEGGKQEEARRKSLKQGLSLKLNVPCILTHRWRARGFVLSQKSVIM